MTKGHTNTVNVLAGDKHWTMECTVTDTETLSVEIAWTCREHPSLRIYVFGSAGADDAALGPFLKHNIMFKTFEAIGDILEDEPEGT